MEKKTPLYNWHETHGGKMVPFGGFLLPVQYETGIITEHRAVREQAGLFDVSHMGEFVIHGKEALPALQWLFTNDFAAMTTGRVRYTLMCNVEGGVIDDLVICKMDDDRFLLVVNASNREKDAAWIKSRLSEEPWNGADLHFEDISDSIAQIALQGPASPSILASVSETIPQKYYTLIEKGKAAGIDCIVSRTGYTGETGFEFYCKSGEAEALWEKLLEAGKEAGKEAGLIPCGLGARDTLRLEASMPLYGHELDETINPFEAALSFAVKMDKDSFIGKEALKGKENPALYGGRIRTGLKVTGRGIVREHCPVFYRGKNIGMTTSGTFCPFLKQALAMALISAEYARAGTQLEVEVRGKMIEAETCALPFYRK